MIVDRHLLGVDKGLLKQILILEIKHAFERGPFERVNGPFWRVVVGPVTSKDEQAEMLAQVRNLGFSDAFLTSR